MPRTIYEDALARPDLFHWFGIDASAFESWLARLPLRVHPGVVDFWRRTGGGDVFESETLLGPLSADESDNVLGTNEFYWSEGLPRNQLIFHKGIYMSASFVDKRRHRNRILVLDPKSFEIRRWFDTFNQWYQQVLRSEYASRYGLLAE